MKIAIASCGEKTHDLVDTRFGMSRYIHIFDSNKPCEYKTIKTICKINHLECEIDAVKIIFENDVDVLLTKNLDANIHKLILSEKIKIYEIEEVSISTAIKSFNCNELKKLECPCKTKGVDLFIKNAKKYIQSIWLKKLLKCDIVTWKVNILLREPGVGRLRKRTDSLTFKPDLDNASVGKLILLCYTTAGSVVFFLFH